jgi:sugar lactone lactonase YvrE
MENCRRLAALLSVLLLLCGAAARAQSVQPIVSGVFAFPVGVALDGAGNLYVADDSNNTVSKVTPAGAVSVFLDASAGLNAPEGLALDGAGNLYIANGGSDTIIRATPAGGVSIFAGGVGEAMGLVFDSAGNLYVSDAAGSTIRKITPAGAVGVFADDPNFLNSPIGMAFDADGNLFVADFLPTEQGGAVTRITPQGVASTFVKFDADNFLFPSGLGFDSKGNLFAATALGPVFEISPGGTITAFDTTSFVSPRGLALDGGDNLFVTDLTAATLNKVTPGDAVTLLAGNVLAEPSFATVDGAGNIYVANTGSRTVGKIAPDGTAVTLVSRAQGVKSPSGMAFDANGVLFLADAGSGTIVTVAADGTVKPFAELLSGSTPQGLAFDAAGTLFVADSGNNVILAVTPGGVVTTFFAEFEGVVMPEGLAFDAQGNLFVSDAGFGTIVKLTPDGRLSTVVPASAGLSVPAGLAFDGNGTLYVANSPGGALPPGIAAVSPSGAVTMFVQGVAALGSPVGLVFQPRATLYAVDQASGSLFRIGVPPPLSSLPAPLLASVLPGGRSVAADAPATVFATILNTGATDLATGGVTLGPTAPSALSLDFQATNPATNQPVGALNQTVAIPANGAASFLLTFQSAGALTASGLGPVFGCDNVQPAPVTPGVSTVDLAFSTMPVADIVALAATAPQPGIVSVPFSKQLPGAFAVASINVGVAGTLTVTADTGAATLPLSILLCPTDPSSGRCLAPLAASQPVTIDAGATPTFSVFITAAAPVAFAPATSRIFLRFLDASGQSHGSTGVAVQTQ